MKTLNPALDLASFCDRLGRSSKKALLLDYDGTLAPFQDEPRKAFPYPGIPEILDRIMRGPGVRVVIISGRWTKDLIPLLKLRRRPEIWGSHGLERIRKDGSYEITAMDERALKGLLAAEEWVETLGLSVRMERKPGCVALHWRGLGKKEFGPVRDRVRPGWSLIAEGWGLSLKDFDGGLELSVPARDKGDAVRTVLREMGEDTLAAYLGDDFTDEDAFKSIKGLGIGILVRPEFRSTNADFWLTPPGELLEFLSCWLPEKDEKTRRS